MLPQFVPQLTERGNLFVLVALLAAVAVVALLAPHNPNTLTAFGTGISGFAGMVIDSQCRLSSAQALTATGVSTNTYDSGAAGNAVGIGEPLCIAFTVDVAADHTTGDETVQFQVIQSANADLSSQDVLAQTDTSFLTATKLVAGYKLYLPIPPSLKSKRYLGARYVLGGTTPSITVTAEIQPLSMVQNDQTYASGYSVGT